MARIFGKRHRPRFFLKYRVYSNGVWRGRSYIFAFIRNVAAALSLPSPNNLVSRFGFIEILRLGPARHLLNPEDVLADYPA